MSLRLMLPAAQALALLNGNAARALQLPPSCAAVSAVTDDTTSIRTLRKRVEAMNETDPAAAFALLCTTIPRVARQYGERSVELAWWAASLATPLIAYMDKFEEALPMLQFAEPILERRYGKYGMPLGDIHVAYAWTYFRQGRQAECAAQWQEALKVRERTPGKRKIELQKVLVGLAQAQIAQRDFEHARAMLERAHAILVENDDVVSEAGGAIENALTNVAFRQERYDDARRHAEEQLRIEHLIDLSAQQLVPAYALLGRIFERLDEYERAEQALRQAVELSEGVQGPLQRHHFTALFQLAALLNERGHPAEARDNAMRALGIGESTLGPMAPRLVPVLQVLGNSEHQLGDLPAALRRFERAGAIIDKDRANVERQWQMDYYRDLGALQLSLGDVEQAERTFATGLAAGGDEPTLSLARAWLLLEHARAAAELGATGSRDELLQSVALLRSRLPDAHPAILRVVNELCALELAAPSQAPYCEEAGRRLDQSRDMDPTLRAAVYDNQSRLAAARQDHPAAHALAIRGLAAAESTATPAALWRAHFQLAQVLRDLNERNLAVFFGKQSILQIERERSHFVGAERRFERAYLRDKVAVYRSVADWLMELGRIDEGLAILALMKTEELSDFGVREARLAVPEREVVLTTEESALQDRYAQAVQTHGDGAAELTHLSVLNETGRISPAEVKRLTSWLAGKGASETHRAERIEQLLHGAGYAAAPDRERRRIISAPALAEAAGAFGPDTTFAVYLLTDQHLRVLVSARGHQEEYRVAVDAAELQRDIGHFLDDIAARREVTALSQRLYAAIARNVDEFAARYRVHRLALWLDGSLRYVPMAALYDGKRYLADKYAIQIYAPAAAANGPADAAARAAPALVRGLGVTQAVAGFPALPAVADELCYVVHGPIAGLKSPSGACPEPAVGNGALRGEGYADGAFTEARLREVLSAPRGFSVLHVGTHFRLRPGNALRSFLLLGDGSKLTLDSLGALDFSGIDVVTLSACETGMGGARTDDGREVEGLSSLVQRRGARRVIASLWQVEDASTAQLMRALYTSFNAAHGDAALGLQQAQRALRSLGARNGRSYENPYYWAGFTVSGSRP